MMDLFIFLYKRYVKDIYDNRLYYYILFFLRLLLLSYNNLIKKKFLTNYRKIR